VEKMPEIKYFVTYETWRPELQGSEGIQKAMKEWS
jgi:hypothetical protein